MGTDKSDRWGDGRPRIWPWAVMIGIVLFIVAGFTIWIGSGDARIPLLLVPVRMVYLALSPEQVASIGSCTDQNSTASCYPVSERFKVKELHRLCDFLNSPEFQRP